MKKLMMLSIIVLIFGNLPAQEKGWKTRLELSYVKTAGNTKTETFSGRIDVEGKGGGSRYFFRSGYLVSKDGGKENANKLTSEARMERVFGGKLFGFVDLNYLRDELAGYDHRVSVGPGFGYDLLRREKHTLKSLVSCVYLWEVYAVEEMRSDGFVSGKVGVDYEWTIKESVTHKAVVNYVVSLENGQKYYIAGESSLRVGLSGAFSIGLSYLVNYQNLVPGPGIRRTDVSFLTSLIVSE